MDELEVYFTLLPPEVEWLDAGAKDGNRLGQAIMLKYFQYAGRFPEESSDVPVDYEGELKLSAVSGSSGKLIVERPEAKREEKWCPGRVFAQEGLSYEEAMAQFAADSRADLTGKPTGSCSPEAVGRTEAKTRKAALRQAAEELKVARWRRRQERQLAHKVRIASAANKPATQFKDSFICPV